MTVKDIDRGWNRIRKLARLGPVVDVGFLGVKGTGRHANGTQSVAQIASYHEYGGGKNKNRPPKRSMIFEWVTDRKKAIVAETVKIAGIMVDGRYTQHQAIGALGSFAQGDIQLRISKGIAPPLKESTLLRKTVRGKVGTTPLIDTGQMRASVGHRPSK